MSIRERSEVDWELMDTHVTLHDDHDQTRSTTHTLNLVRNAIPAMSSRDDRRRRERSWERDDRDRARDRGVGRDRDRRDREREGGRDRNRERDGERERVRKGDYDRRRSRSKSPVRKGGERDRRDYGRDRYDDRRDRDRDRYRERDRDRLEERRPREDKEGRQGRADDTKLPPPRDRNERGSVPPPRSGPPQNVANGPNSGRPNLDPDYDGREEGEEREDSVPMEAENDEEAAMRAMMGFAGFDSTKGKPVVGNEDGAVNIKKTRTWRQYMNRRGGFNRPLDKIK